jgi:hypothetical protein
MRRSNTCSAPGQGRSCARAAAFVVALVVTFVRVDRAPAQEIARFTGDSVIAVDIFGGENVSSRPQIVIDASTAVRVSDHWQLLFRPWLRQARPSSPTAAVPDVDVQLYQAGARYERPGRISTRLDLGEIVSPVGLGMLDWRPNLNPTIVPHLSYVVPMPVFDVTVPRQVPVSQSYPLGGLVTVSSVKWDIRAAVVNAAPTRGWAVGAANNPRSTPVVEGGAGITPVIGLRLGVSLAHGQYATGAEAPRTPDGRSMTLVGGEGEFAFGYTKLSGEVVRTAFETSTGTAVAYEYFLQGMQTLTPRLFAAARYEATSAPPLNTGIVPGVRTHMNMVEATAGFRLNREIIVRSSFYTRHSYTATAWDQQFGLSLVWTRRWW